VTVTASAPNTPPVAHAGPDQGVAAGALVTLDGTGSSDAEGDPLTYAWSLVSVPAGSGAVLSDPTAAMPTFTADLAGDYGVELVVNDGQAESAPDSVTVTASAPDADGDGIPDALDNCLLIANGPSAGVCYSAGVQIDTDGDGYGNICDGDFNNDGVTNATDATIFNVDFNAGIDGGRGTDMSCDGVVNASDATIFNAQFDPVPS